MSLIVEYDFDADEFSLGRAASPDVSVELEGVVTDGDTARQYFWAYGPEQARFRRRLEDEGAVEGATVLDGTPGANLYRGETDSRGDTLLAGISTLPEELLSCAGDDDDWTMRLLFDGPAAAAEFREFCTGPAGVEFDDRRAYTPARDVSLTDRQRRTLVTAHRAGYFEIPRRTTLVDLADRLGVSDQAVSERMRRGESQLIETCILDDGDRNGEDGNGDDGGGDGNDGRK